MPDYAITFFASPAKAGFARRPFFPGLKPEDCWPKDSKFKAQNSKLKAKK